MNASATPPADDEAEPDAGVPVYAYKPNLMGAPWVFKLTADGLAWQLGRRSGLIRYDQVQRVRLSYRPSSMQSHRFLTEIWSPQTPKIQISSTTLRSLMEQARQDADYVTFVTELHRRLAAAGSAAQFQRGMNPALYWIGAAVLAGCGVGLAWIMVRTLMNADWTGTIAISAVILLCVWQAGTIFYRNRPQTYRPEALPAVVLPRQ